MVRWAGSPTYYTSYVETKNDSEDPTRPGLLRARSGSNTPLGRWPGEFRGVNGRSKFRIFKNAEFQTAVYPLKMKPVSDDSAPFVF